MLDRGGAKRPVVLGCVLAAVGFSLWAGKVTQLNFCTQLWPVILSGRRHGVHARSGQHRCRQPGVPALLRGGDRHHPDGPELRRQPGFAILGTILVTEMRSRLTTSLLAQGRAEAPGGRARRPDLAQSRGGGGSVASIPHFYRLDFAYATRSVLYVMAGIMAVAAVVALFGLRAGLQEDPGSDGVAPVGEGRTAPADA